MPWTSLVSVFLLAALGGLHCAAMCGGVISAFSLDRFLPGAGWGRVSSIANYHLGRIFSYCVLGAIAGAASGALLPWRELRLVQLSVYGLAGQVMIWLAWRLWGGRQAWPSIERRAAGLLAPLRRLIGTRVRSGSSWARLAMGAAWGLVPCGMVYGALSLALLSGSAVWGAILMLVFGLGTLPNLLLADWFLRRARRAPTEFWRRAAAVLIAGFGAWAIYVVLWDRERISPSFFCALP